MEVVDYEYIEEVSTLEALRNLASDTTNWYAQDLPWVNTFLINAAAQAYNFPEGAKWIAWWSTNVSWSSSAYNSISWSSWKIFLPDWTEIDITAGSASLSATTYIYVDQQDWSVYYTTSAADSVGENKILLCVASPTASWKSCAFQAFGNGDQSTFITASNIAANTITGNEIQANSITSTEIHSWAITTSKLDAWAVTASKIDVSQLSAISANLWTITAWDITGTTVTAGSTSGTAIKLNPDNKRIEFYYWWTMVGYIAGWSVDWNGGILIDASFAGMTGRDTFDLYNAKLRIPVWNNLYS